MYQHSKILEVMIGRVDRYILDGRGLGFRDRQTTGYNNAQFTPPDAT